MVLNLVSIYECIDVLLHSCYLPSSAKLVYMAQQLIADCSLKVSFLHHVSQDNK